MGILAHKITTGSGKSTLVNLLLKFYDVNDNEIIIDRQNITKMNPNSVRKNIAVIPQNANLFNRSVMENIRYGRLEASDSEVEQVTRRIGRGDWVVTLDNGLATAVSERGRNLSMGQRQLVILARVLLQDPSVVILDEATSNVDALTEALIQEGLEELVCDRTAVVIAHRLSTIRNADRIVVLREGRIIEQGDHKTLSAAGGHYAELYDTYFRHQSLEYIERRHAPE